jgi:hypothetical protein
MLSFFEISLKTVRKMSQSEWKKCAKQYEFWWIGLDNLAIVRILYHLEKSASLLSYL